jgi:hypothetical protein
VHEPLSGLVAFFVAIPFACCLDHLDVTMFLLAGGTA